MKEKNTSGCSSVLQLNHSGFSFVPPHTHVYVYVSDKEFWNIKKNNGYSINTSDICVRHNQINKFYKISNTTLVIIWYINYIEVNIYKKIKWLKKLVFLKG